MDETSISADEVARFSPQLKENLKIVRCHRALQQFLNTLTADLPINANGMEDTALRVAKAFVEMSVGYQQSPEVILSRVFDEPTTDEIILLKDIPFQSMCEHHLMVFEGIAHVAYLPASDRVVGLSKLARLVECYTRRFQIQERISMQVATALMTYLKPLGAACIVKATHSCMSCRGIRKSGASMVTSCMLGCFRDSSQTRNELMSLIRL